MRAYTTKEKAKVIAGFGDVGPQAMSALHRIAESSRTSRHVQKVPILLQKSVAADGCPLAIRLRAAGFDLPTLMRSTQLQRYAMHRA